MVAFEESWKVSHQNREQVISCVILCKMYECGSVCLFEDLVVIINDKLNECIQPNGSLVDYCELWYKRPVIAFPGI